MILQNYIEYIYIIILYTSAQQLQRLWLHSMEKNVFNGRVDAHGERVMLQGCKVALTAAEQICDLGQSWPQHQAVVFGLL